MKRNESIRMTCEALVKATEESVFFITCLFMFMLIMSTLVHMIFNELFEFQYNIL